MCGFIETLGQPNITGVDKYLYVDSNFGNILRIECQDNHASYKAIGNYTDKSSWKCWLSMNYLFYWCLMSKYYYKHRCIQDKRATTHNHNSFNFLFIFFLIIYAASSRRKESTKYLHSSNDITERYTYVYTCLVWINRCFYFAPNGLKTHDVVTMSIKLVTRYRHDKSSTKLPWQIQYKVKGVKPTFIWYHQNSIKMLCIAIIIINIIIIFIIISDV